MTNHSSRTVCPRCQSARIVLGEVTRGRTLGPSEPFGFRAYAARLSSIRTGVPMTPGVCACSECGLVWGELAPARLLAQLRQFANADVADWLSSSRPVPL